MTIHIQMLQDIATHARAMADSMQAIVDDCAEQLARRKAAGESEESIMNEPFKKESAQNASASLSTRRPRTALRPMKALRLSMRNREAWLLQRRLPPLARLPPRPHRNPS